MKTLLLLLLGPWVLDDIPSIQDWVEDRITLLSTTQQETLRQKLIHLEKTGGTQVVILIVSTTSPYSIEEFSIRTATKAKIGQKGLDNGVLITVAKDDRKVRIEVGKGLEGKLTDAVCSWIIRNHMVPRFKSGNYFEGLNAGVDKVLETVRGSFTVMDGEGSDLTSFFVILLFFISIFLLFLPLFCKKHFATHNRSNWWGYSGGGGWSGSGGGGGFSGGGGSFGGGGASGSW